MGLLDVSALLILVITISFSIFQYFDMQWTSINLELMTQSRFALINVQQVGVVRLIFCTIIWCSIYFSIFIEPTIIIPVAVPGKPDRLIRVKGFEKLSFFYCLELVVARILTIGWILFEVSYAMALLVSTVVNFVLIPETLKNKASVAHFFTPLGILMHNANVIFMTFELVVGRVPFSTWHFPFILLYGSSYAVFSWIWNYYKDVFYYFFMDYNRSGAVYWYIGLMVTVSLFFMIGNICYNLLNNNSFGLWVLLLLLGGTSRVLRFAE
eukprot:gene4484-6338_t